MEDDRIEVTVLWFAALRELRGSATERVRARAGTRVDRLFADLVGPEPRMTVAYVVNRVRVPAATVLSDGDEVAFLPPLGGG